MERGEPMGDLQRDEAGIRFHYDLPPEFFATFLDSGMNYSCAYFDEDDEPLEAAARRKLELIARKLRLRPGDRVLDIGCGWGGFLFHAAAEHGASATGITLSPAQADFVRQRAEEHGLSDRVRVELVHALAMPYAPESFDKIVTVGAIEHISDLPKLFTDCARLLTPHGWMLVHGMSRPWPLYQRNRNEPPGAESKFLREQIFPVGELIPFREHIAALEVGGFEVVDVENITDHYTLTLLRWLENLQSREEELFAQGLVDPTRLRAQVAFLAGSAVGFQDDGIRCYQTLCRKISAAIERPPLPLRRDYLERISQ